MIFRCCHIKEIQGEKRSKLKENIKYLEDLSNKFEQSINELKILFEKINKDKEELKLKIQKIFTKLRNSLNEKEDQLLIEVDEKFNDLFIKEDMIRENEKLPNLIKKSLEKGKLIDKEWNENNLSALIKDCIDIENNIKKLNEIDENIKKNHLNKNIKIDFSLEDYKIKKILDKIKNIGEITINDETINNIYNDFDINTKNPLYQLNNHSKAIICLILMKDGRLVSGSNDNSIMIYNKISYTPDLVIKEHDNPVLCIIQLSSGVLASSSEDKTIKLFKIDNDKYEILQILNYHTKAIWKIIELKDKSLASCSEDCSIIFYVKDNLEYKKEYSFRVDDNSYCSSMLQIKDNEICYSTNNKKIHFYDLLQKKITIHYRIFLNIMEEKNGLL